jgi:hypothetical protein
MIAGEARLRTDAAQLRRQRADIEDGDAAVDAAQLTSDRLEHQVGIAGGLCDDGDGADEPASLASVAAGWPFFGQFVAHDITADRSTPQAHADLSQLRNARSPRLNLEGLYGDGPIGHPFPFQRDDPAKLLTAPGGRDLL